MSVDQQSEPHISVNTPDVTLTYAAWLYHARQNQWLHLCYDVRALYDMALWDFGEDGSCYHHYQNQHESLKVAHHQYPASHDKRTHYFEESAVPQHRPTASNFSVLRFSYPLENTRRIFACSPCGGSGQIICVRCEGKGRCSYCKGSGRFNGKRCYSCSGNRKCSRCGGSGQVMCGTCQGEGQLLAYVSHDYKWWHDTDEETILRPQDDNMRLKGLVTATRRKGGSVRLAEFSQSEVVRATGVFNSRIQEVLQRAEEKRRQLEGKIHERSTRILFQEIRRDYVPLLYINLFAGRKYGQCFVAGTSEEQSVHFPLPLSLIKCSAWAALIAFLILLIIGSTSALLLGLNCVILAALVVGGIHQSWQANMSARPERWLVFDDEQSRAWQFAYLYAQAISRSRVARITDPWFTTLLEPPIADSVQGRNSFLYTINETTEQEKTPAEIDEETIAKPIKKTAEKTTEFLVIGKRAQSQFPAEVNWLAAGANRLILLSNGETVEALRGRITALLTARSAQNSAPLRITVVTDIGDVNDTERYGIEACNIEKYDVEKHVVQISSGEVVYGAAENGQMKEEKPLITVFDFASLSSAEQGITFEVIALPLAQMCAEARVGSLTGASETGYHQLSDFGGYPMKQKRL